MDNSFEVTCNLPLQETTVRIAALLAERGVVVHSDGIHIESIEIPMILGNWSRLKFSKSNWVGLNPFVQISGIDIKLESPGDKDTKLTVHVNQLRGYGYVAFVMLIGIAIALVVPLLVGIIVLVALTGIYWASLVLLVRHLIKRELENALKG